MPADPTFPLPAPAPGFRPGVGGVLLALLGLAVVLLRAEGRRWWCAAGDWLPWSTGIRDAHTSQHLFDPYSLTHLLHGFLFYAGLWLVARRLRRDVRLALAVVLECAWELAENSPAIIERYRVGTIALGYDGDSVANSLGDILACAGGFLLASRLPVRAAVAVFLLVELGLLAVYRDNLLLNVLMLLHPIDAIRQWQAGHS